MDYFDRSSRWQQLHTSSASSLCVSGGVGGCSYLLGLWRQSSHLCKRWTGKPSTNRDEHCERSLLANFETVSVFQGEPPAIFAIKLDAVQCDCRSRRAANRLIQPGDTKNGVAKQHITWSMFYFRAADAMRDNTPHRGKPFSLSYDISVLDHERASTGNPVSSPRPDRVTARKTRLRNPCSGGQPLSISSIEPLHRRD